MLDLNIIRENPDLIKDATAKKRKDPSLVDKLLKVDQKYRDQLQQIEKLRAERNTLTKESIDRGQQIKQELKDLEPQLNQLKSKILNLQTQIPNLIHPEVKIGRDESENEIIKTWGQPTKFDFEPQDHVDLGEALDLIDIETSAKVSGTRFNYLKNEAVLIQFALIQFVFETLTDQKIISQLAKQVGNPSTKTFVPVLPPVIFKADIAKKMDRYHPIEDRYYFAQDDTLFVGSAEHTLGPMFMDQTLNEKDLPLRYIGYSTAFRREAGSYGKDTKGILRRHQFDKLEMEIFSTAETGELEQNLIIAIQEHLIQELNIPYQVINICTGDMGKPDYRQIDINCWMPGQNQYRETHTSDYMTDYQARRLNTKYKTKNGKTEYVHMNDATAFAIGRILIAILENYQQSDGSVAIPRILQKWVGKNKIAPK